MPSDPLPTVPFVPSPPEAKRATITMPLCFIDPQDAIRVMVESVGREARRQLLGELVRAWVDEIPEAELASHYAKALTDLDEHDLSMLAAWHASMEVGMPVANKEFLMGAFQGLGPERSIATFLVLTRHLLFRSSPPRSNLQQNQRRNSYRWRAGRER